MSINCKFGERFQEILLDCFVSRLQPTVILDGLCEEETLTLKQAIDVAVTKESSVQVNLESLDECVLNSCRSIENQQDQMLKGILIRTFGVIMEEILMNAVENTISSDITAMWITADAQKCQNKREFIRIFFLNNFLLLLVYRFSYTTLDN